MAPKRAAPRTESVNRQSKGSSNRQQRVPLQGGLFSRLTQVIDQSNRRRNILPLQTIDLTSSDLSSEISQIDTPRSLDRTSSAASLVELSPPSKRRRLDTEVDYSSNYHQNPGFRGGRTESVIGSDHPSSSFEAGPGSSNRRKTGSCNSKRQRGKGYVGGSSSDHSFVTDSNQPTATTDDSHCLSPTAHSCLVTMPANLEDLPSTSKVSTRGDVSSRSHEPSGTSVEASGSSSTATGHWLRSFTCFANSADGEQTALDLSVESTRSGNAHPGTGSNQPITDATVFSNPAQAELADEGSSVSENISRLVTSLSYSAIAASAHQNPSSSSSRNLRHQRGGGGASTSSRLDSSGPRRGNQGSGRQSSSRNIPTPSTSSNPGVHIHGVSSSSQSQSHHHSIQGSGINYRIMQLKTVRGDVSAQMVLLQEINQALLMGSDDSLAGLAVQELVSGVVDLLSAENALSCLPEEEMIEIKNLCCNILAHLMDVIPKAADTVVMAVPLLINIMSCSLVGDILERIINVLEQVSRRNGREVLHCGAVPSVMGIYDFVTVAQHRTILSMVANCFANVRKEDFDSHIAGCLQSLCERLSPMSSTEPRCLERICLCFARLVHAFKSEPEKLRHIASFGLCEHLRHLLAASPPIVSNMRDIANMLATLCTYCPDLAVDILKMGYSETIYNLLTDQKSPELSLQSPTAKYNSTCKGPRSTLLRNSIARTLESRGADNVSAIINLIKAMLPPVQESGLLLTLPTNPASLRGTRLNVPSISSNVQIALFEEQCMEFENLVCNFKPKSGGEKSGEKEPSANIMVVKAVHLLLPMLLDLYTEVNGISSRLKCIESIQRIVCNVSPFVLSWVISPRAVSSMVADMLGNPEFSLIAAGIQLVNIFVTRVPNVFAVYFRKEGVLFHLKRLSTLAEDVEEANSTVTASSAQDIVQHQHLAAMARPSTSGDTQEATPYQLRSSNYAEPIVRESETSRIASRRRRHAPRSPHFIDSVVHDSPEPSPSGSYESSETSSSNSTLDMDLSVDVSPTLTSQSPVLISVEGAGYHDNNLRAWIKAQCQELFNRIQTLLANTPKPETLVSKAAASGKKSVLRHHSTPLQSVSAPPRDLLPELEALSLQLKKIDDPAAWIEGLVHLASLLIQQLKSASDNEAPSPFEIQHSGMLSALQSFLTEPSERRLRLFLFLRVFLGPHYTQNFDLSRVTESPKMLSLTKSALLSLKQKPDVHDLAFPMMVNCLLDCLHQQEHFQVLMNPASQASTEVYAEEMIIAMRQAAPPLPTPPSHRRSGGRRTHTGLEEDPSPTPRPIMPRRLAGMAPGYVKLELIRQVDETSTATTSKKSLPDSPSPIWDRAAPVTSLQVSSLLTAQRLRNQLIQRIMINSVMQSPEGGISRDLLLDPEEGLLTSFSIPSSLTHRRRVGASGGRRTTQERSDAPSIRSGVRTEILSIERELLSARSRENSHARSMSLLAAFGMLQFPGSASGVGNSPTAPVTLSSSQQTTNQHQPEISYIPSPAHSSTSHSRSASGPSANASLQAPLASSRNAASSSATLVPPSSSALHSTRYQSQTQSGHRPGHHHHPSMMLSGGPSAAAEFFESVSVSGAPVPVFYIDGFRIPDRMPLYQALRTFSIKVKERARQLLAEHRFSMTEQNREDRINAFIWRTVHTIHYRLEKPSTISSAADPLVEFQFPTSTSPTPSISSGAVTKHSPSSSLSAAISCLKRSRRSEESARASPPPALLKPAVDRLFTFLEPLTECSALNKGCMAANLGLLRILYGLSEFGNTLDDLVEPYPIIPADHFHSQKLSAKASRQLQDVFYVLAGNLPKWLVQTISRCPFLFPFSVRQNFFYVYNFDRERTILHLQDTITNSSTEDEATGSTGSSRGGSSRRDRDGRSSFVHRISSHFGRNAINTVRYGGFDGGAAILENLLTESANQLNKHKIVVSRDPKRLLRAAETAMNDLRDSRSGLEIAFEGEVGFGLGPTLEFYTLVSHQLMTASLNLWHGENYTTDGYIIAPAPGLYPRPLPKNLRSAQSREIRSKFFFLGQLMARALFDWRQLDLSLSPVLFKWFLYVQNPEEDIVLSGPRVGVTPADLALVDPPFAKHFHNLLKLSRRRKELVDESLLNKAAASAIDQEIRAIDNEVDDLCVTFVLPGYQIDLCRNGSQMSVTGNLLSQYLHLVAHWYLVEGVRRQVTALIAGFDSVLPGVRTGKLATLFRPDECEGLFCGSGSLGGLYRDQLALLRTGGASHVAPVMQTFISSKNSDASSTAVGWDVDTLMKSCLCDHGYTHQSTAIQYLFEIMSEFDETQRRLFIQFATGSPRLPIGGFRALKPPLKIVMKREAEEHADQHLPSVMTCQNYLKLPNYSSKKIMLEKLLYAIHEGQHAFHLS